MEIGPKIKYPLPVKIVGIGRYLPKRIVPNSDLEIKCNLPSGWCERKQGVRERRWAEGEETLIFMGAKAAQDAVKDAGLEFTDIDLIISACQAFQQGVPENGTLIQKELGLGESGIPCMSVTCACLSFIVAFDLCTSLISLDCYKNILIVTSEITSVNLDFSNPNVSTMMGDGAVAAVISKTPLGEYSSIHAMLMETYGEASHVSSVSGGGTHKTFFSSKIEKKDFVFNFDPHTLQNSGMKYNKKFLSKLWPTSNYSSLKLIIPNQASRLALDYAKLIFPANKVMGIIDKYGNCGAVGYPLALFEAIRSKRIHRGDMVLLTGMGAGFSLQGMVLTY